MSLDKAALLPRFYASDLRFSYTAHSISPASTTLLVNSCGAVCLGHLRCGLFEGDEFAGRRAGRCVLGPRRTVTGHISLPRAVRTTRIVLGVRSGCVYDFGVHDVVRARRQRGLRGRRGRDVLAALHGFVLGPRDVGNVAKQFLPRFRLLRADFNRCGRLEACAVECIADCRELHRLALRSCCNLE
ncbi:hypothetical protein A5769_14230 [Mycobacterium intracellulare]|nr:hypothetical protein A5769_14230 [Mycobacterium intracellulare]